jgi:hypothetical protein
MDEGAEKSFLQFTGKRREVKNQGPQQPRFGGFRGVAGHLAKLPENHGRGDSFSDLPIFMG